MKRLILCLLTLACIICLLTACNMNTRYKITLPDLSVLPEGIESFETTQGTEVSGDDKGSAIYFTSGKGGSFFVTVRYKDGYDKGDFKVFANGNEAAIRNDQFPVIDYEVYPTSNVNITFTGSPSIKSYAVTSTYNDFYEGGALDEFAYELKYVWGTEESTPIKAASLGELNDKINADKKIVRFGTKIILTATHTGEIAFPAAHMVYFQYSELGDYAQIKTRIVGNTQIRTWEVAVLSDVELNLWLSSTSQDTSRNIYTDATILEGGVYDGKFNRIQTLQALYDTQGRVYAPLSVNKVIYRLIEKYKQVTVNGKTSEGRFVYNEENKRWYIELGTPDSYNGDKADGYDIDFAEGVNDYMRGDSALTNDNVEFKSQLMDWGEDIYIMSSDDYNGYRLKDDRLTLCLCFANSVNDIKVIVNGTKEFVFRNIQTIDEETKDFATIYRFGGNNAEYDNNYYGLNGKNETHRIVFNPSSFGQVTSVQIVLAN